MQTEQPTKCFTTSVTEGEVVRVSVMFHFMFVHYTFSSAGLLSGHLLGNSCPLG